MRSASKRQCGSARARGHGGRVGKAVRSGRDCNNNGRGSARRNRDGEGSGVENANNSAKTEQNGAVSKAAGASDDGEGSLIQATTPATRLENSRAAAALCPDSSPNKRKVGMTISRRVGVGLARSQVRRERGVMPMKRRHKRRHGRLEKAPETRKRQSQNPIRRAKAEAAITRQVGDGMERSRARRARGGIPMSAR